MRTWVAFLLGAGGFGAAELTGGDLPIFVVSLFIAGVAGALVASGSARIWASLLGCWAGLAGNLVIQFVAGEANGTWSVLVPVFVVILAVPVLVGAAAVVAIRNIGQR